MSTIVESIETMNIKKYKKKLPQIPNPKMPKKKVKVSKNFSMNP